MPKSIAILTDEQNPEISGTRYFLTHLKDIWESMGIAVHVSRGCHYVPADIAILHVDKSVVEDRYLELAARYPVAINGGVKSILKSSFSDHILTRDADYEGRVIVKTDANYGGTNEYLASQRSSDVMIPELDFERPWRKREILDSYNYPVFNSIRDVPPGVWKNNRLIVEKLCAEQMENGEYRTRGYLFFGQQELGVWFSLDHPVIKGGTATSWGLLDSIPETLREVRRQYGFGYGRFDFNVVNGEVVLFDINKTPALGDTSLSLVSEQQKNKFAKAILEFI